MKSFKPPTLQEMLDYQAENPELSGIDISSLHNAYSKTGWISTDGKKIKNWKLKLHTLSKYNPPKLCHVTENGKRCNQPARKWTTRDGVKFYMCPKHLPNETPCYDRKDRLPKKNDEMITQDKVQAEIKKLADKMKI